MSIEFFPQVIELSSRNFLFCSVHWNPDALERPESATSFDMSLTSKLFFFNSNCFCFPLIAFDSFLLEACNSILRTFMFVVCKGVGILIGQRCQKCDQYRHASTFSFILIKIYSFYFLHQVLKWRCFTFGWLLIEKCLILLFKMESRPAEKAIINKEIKCRILFSEFSKANGLSFPVKVTMEMLSLAEIFRFVKFSFCLPDQSFLWSYKVECRSLTALFVKFFLCFSLPRQETFVVPNR